ncbi:DUF397 domain-containing protein [Streptomyces brevispora]|uniref:DUF397 domain-containing protein n=1 Tax=Streptomyces brevispora TaxID=887462 RepID=UPI0033C41294
MNRPLVITQWRKSSYSNGTGGECVEVADLESVIGVRDSTRLGGPHIAVRRGTWSDFVSSLRGA